MLNNKMDFRKIIKFGKSSHVISLPKNWLNKNNLDKGDIVYINETDFNLIISSNQQNKRKEVLSIEIDVSNIDTREIERRIISAYIQNYNVIHLYGKNFSSKVNDIKEAIQNIMALEIMEETSEKITAKDFLKMDEISLIDLLKRMDIITRAMFLDTKKVFTNNNLVENIYDRDKDVNRLTFLVYRLIQFYFENPIIASEKNITPKKLISYSTGVRNIERIADNCKRISKLLLRLELTNGKKEEIISLLDDVFNHYENLMKAFYKSDIQKAFKLANEKHNLIKKSRFLYENIWAIKWAPTVVEKIKDIIDCTHAIGRDLYH